MIADEFEEVVKNGRSSNQFFPLERTGDQITGAWMIRISGIKARNQMIDGGRPWGEEQTLQVLKFPGQVRAFLSRQAWAVR